MQARPDYRPDIDGLRAVAVLAVVLFHVFPSALPGGFVGVDVFFVISGYLITGLILRDLAAGTFSFSHFYTRRIKRLLPASAVVSLATLLGASWLLVPNDYVYFTTSLAAAWGFASNIFFSLLSGGYFDSRFELFPLLHTWSLAVEEQFYFVFPVLLVWLYRRHRSAASLMLVFGAVFAAGVLLAWLLRAQPNHYYLLTTRTHELMAGALAAVWAQRAVAVPPVVARVCVPLAAAALVYSLVVFSGSLSYPGLHSLVPTLATVALVLCVPAVPIVRSALASRGMVAIGLMSYSIYLWHWPIVSLLKYRGIALGGITAALAVAAVFVLSYATWRWVEQPVRRSRLSLRRAILVIWLPPALIAFGIAAASLATQGVPARFDPEVRKLIASYSQERDLTRRCTGEAGVDLDALATHCAFGAAGAGAPTVLLYGDSHAAHYRPFVDVLAQDAGLSAVYTALGACAPARPAGEPVPAECEARNHAVANAFERFRAVVLAGNWDARLRAEDLLPLVDRIESAGARVVILGTVPIGAEDHSRCVLRRARGWLDAAERCEIPLQEVKAGSDAVDLQLVRLLEMRPRIRLEDPKALLCTERGCATELNGLAVYRDSNHLNAVASEELARVRIRAAANPLKAQP